MGMLIEAFKRFGPAYLEKYQDSMLPGHKKALHDILACREGKFGKVGLACETCGLVEEMNGACRNRACVKCNGCRVREWIEKTKKRLPGVTYYHLVFTIPSELRDIARRNQKVFYQRMFWAVKETLFNYTDSQWIKGDIGFISFLHTWDTKLLFHPHLHVVVLGGYFGACGRFVKLDREQFIPNSVLSKKFKTCFLNSLRDDLKQNIPSPFWKQKWVVFTKRSFDSSESVIEYLGRYVKKLAISESRMVALTNDGVSFRYRQHKGRNEKPEKKIMFLPGEDFLRRYFQHVLPARFVRVRYNGLLHTAHNDFLEMLREEEGQMTPEEEIEPKPQKLCKECMLPLVTAYMLIPAFLRGSAKLQKGNVLYNIPGVPPDPQIHDYYEKNKNPAYNNLLEPIGFGCPSACVSKPRPPTACSTRPKPTAQQSVMPTKNK